MADAARGRAGAAPERRLPLAVLAGLVLTASMLLPMSHALVNDRHEEARAFFYWAILLGAGFGLLGLATARRAELEVRGQLVSLVVAFALLPLAAALPVMELRPEAGLGPLWVEMIAAATTTGGSLFADVEFTRTIHLWRALVAWQGGLLVWIAAAAILAPLSLGGFEVLAPGGARLRVGRDGSGEVDARARVGRAVRTLGPIYVGLTLSLWLLLSLIGTDPTVAAIHAMSTLSTSGITGGVAIASGGLLAEFAVAAFLIFAVTRRAFATDLHRRRIRGMAEDREARLAFVVVLATALILFARHWLGSYEVSGMGTLRAAAGALWGAAFTALSFLTTAGFVSAEWSLARGWSGLESPAVLLMGLALFGGGVATTAGGVKLLRIYALYAHGRREMDLLVHPSAAGGHGAGARRLSRAGIEAAWIFFMLFALSLAGAVMAFTATGVSFEAAAVLAVAALATCGPLVDAAGIAAARLGDLPAAAQGVFAVAMVLGRLEALALIALFNPAFWR
ncbi:TrkH family potassium uptake protein [Jannaschia sp. Os4]|uniref:potassium transporter TrkG n=1 Tax=Jannaschia sp. Os4 TaxID=2807617 RepID=UPI00193956E8|nr:potassium transporter TrkG [Jannaschia sp. Os4]MBM2576508.1 TrkH family potassium uptake protein [Jannaschia sp. Os4]